MPCITPLYNTIPPNSNKCLLCASCLHIPLQFAYTSIVLKQKILFLTVLCLFIQMLFHLWWYSFSLNVILWSWLFFEFSPTLFTFILKNILLFLWSLLASFCETIIAERWVFQNLMWVVREPSDTFLKKSSVHFYTGLIWILTFILLNNLFEEIAKQ